MSFEIHEMMIENYDEIYQLWEMSDNIGLSNADSRFRIEKFLKRNPGMSFVAWADKKMIGAVFTCVSDTTAVEGISTT